MLQKLTNMFRKKNLLAHTPAIAVPAVPSEHPHSFSCECEACTKHTAHLTEERLKLIRK